MYPAYLQESQVWSARSFCSGKDKLGDSTTDQRSTLGPIARASFQVREGETVCPGLKGWGQQARSQSLTCCPWERLRTKARMGPGTRLDGSCLGDLLKVRVPWFPLSGVSSNHHFRKESQTFKTWEDKNSERNTSSGGSWFSPPLSCIFFFPRKSFSLISAITATLSPKGTTDILVQASTKPLSLEIFVEQELPVFI